MRRFIRFWSFAVVLTTAIVFSSCTKDSVLDTLPSAEEVTFNFVVDDLAEGTVGADGSDSTRSVVDDVDVSTSVKNMWVIQFDAGGGYVAAEYSSSFSVTDAFIILGTTKTIVFIANTFDEDLVTDGMSLDDLKNLSRSSVLSSDEEDNQYCVMNYTISNYPLTFDGIVSLKRNCVKVTVSVDNGISGTCVLDKIETINVPDKSYYYTDYEIGDKFPAAVTTKSIEWSEADMSSGTSSGITFYLPVNKRGTTENQTSMSKPIGAPDNATAVKLSYISKESLLTRTYTFFLGANMTCDFNLLPNYSYRYTLDMTEEGNSFLDPRIEVSVNDDWYSYYSIGIDVSDQKLGGIMISKTDHSTTMLWNAAQSAYPDSNAKTTGRLPTQKELMLMYAFRKESDGYTSDTFWSATKSDKKDDSNNAYVWVVSFDFHAYGFVAEEKTNCSFIVRPVREL